ncbi:MAG TPA: viral A-type inclusion protein, partial [Chitinophagaceae bacterium]|nr:viral A-type inclusion protein [Chitinophagaceae bacterium]
YLDKTKTALDSLQKLPIEKVDVLYRQDLLDLQEKLSNAKNAMNNWMDGFKIDSAKGNTALREQYLENEKEKINKVKDDIMKGLQKADSIFNK